MPDHMMSPILLVGAGPMAVAYANVLKAMGTPYVAIGRGEDSAREFEAKTGKSILCGGVDACLRQIPVLPGRAIVAVGMEQLAPVSLSLLRHGIASLLVEKPGGLQADEIGLLADESDRLHADVRVAYNRRFYASVRKAREMIAADGGVTSFAFEFTEWAHKIAPLSKAKGIKENWILGNSSHVIDLAFFLGGNPTEWQTYRSGSLPWHPAGSVFAGAGISEAGALFSYHADWTAPGRWGVEMMTRSRRLILRPLETLQVQRLGSLEIAFAELDEEIDKAFKPGVYRQVEAWLAGGEPALMTIQEQARKCGLYQKMIAPGELPR